MITMLDTPIERLLAAGLLFAIPPVIFYLVMQRYIVAGITGRRGQGIGWQEQWSGQAE